MESLKRSETIDFEKIGRLVSEAGSILVNHPVGDPGGPVEDDWFVKIYDSFIHIFKLTDIPGTLENPAALKTIAGEAKT